MKRYSYRQIVNVSKVVDIIMTIIIGMLVCIAIDMLVSCGSSKKVIEKELSYEYHNRNNEVGDVRLDCLLNLITIQNTVYIHEKDCTYVDSAGVIHRDRTINKVEANNEKVEAKTTNNVLHTEKDINEGYIEQEKNKEAKKDCASNMFMYGAVSAIIFVVIVICLIVVWYVRTKKRR